MMALILSFIPNNLAINKEKKSGNNAKFRTPIKKRIIRIVSEVPELFFLYSLY